MTMFVRIAEKDLQKVASLGECERVVLYEYTTKQGETFKVTATKKDTNYYFNVFSIDDEKLDYYMKK